jgi:hypothetical protein
VGGCRDSDESLEPHADDAAAGREQRATSAHARTRASTGRLARGAQLLDDAARALNEADRCHRDIYDDLGSAEKKKALMHAGRAMEEMEQRLAIRFGSEYEIRVDMAACIEYTLRVFGATTQWALNDYDHARKQAEDSMA